MSDKKRLLAPPQNPPSPTPACEQGVPPWALEDAKQRYQDPAVVQAYDAMRFVGLRGRLIDALEKTAIRRALAVVRRELPCPCTLDIPCGTGRITELLLKQGLQVTGGDVSLPMLEEARVRLAPYGDRVKLQRLDLEALELPDGSFDLLTCIRLFNHFGVPQRERFLSELSRVTRRFVVLNVSYASPLYRVHEWVKTHCGVVRPKDPSSWSALVRQAEAVGLRVKRYYHELPGLSEVVVLLLEKAAPARDAPHRGDSGGRQP